MSDVCGLKMERVLLFKSPEGSEDYQSLFENNRYVPMFIPVLEFVFQDLDLLLNKLKDVERYSGIIFTSPRSVDAVTACLKLGSRSILQQWEGKHTFVVGEVTNRKVLKDLNLGGCGHESGNGCALAKFITETNNVCNFDKPLLFPCGNLKSEVLPQSLSEENIPLEAVVVYNTIKNHTFDEAIHDLHNRGGIPSILIFFSPSGVDFVVPLLRELSYDFENSKVISIGPSTEKRLKDNRVSVFATAREPSALGIFHSIHDTLLM